MELILPPLWTGQILTQAKSSICVGNWLWSRHVQLSEGTEQSLLHWPILFNQPILCQWKIKIETTPRWKHTMNPLYLCPITSAKRKRSLQPQHYQKSPNYPPGWSYLKAMAVFLCQAWARLCTLPPWLLALWSHCHPHCSTADVAGLEASTIVEYNRKKGCLFLRKYQAPGGKCLALVQ